MIASRPVPIVPVAGRNPGIDALFRDGMPFNRCNGTMLALIAAVALLMLAFTGGWGGRRVAGGTAWLRSFGLTSYEIDLADMFVVFAVINLFHRRDGSLCWGWMRCAPVLALSWGLGCSMERLPSPPIGGGCAAGCMG